MKNYRWQYLWGILFLIVMFVLGSFSSLMAEGDTLTVKAKGIAKISGTVSRDIREVALEDAQKSTLVTAVNNFVEDDVFQKNYSKIKTGLLDKWADYVINYLIDDEQKDPSAGVYRIWLSAKIDQEKLINQLKNLGLLKIWKIAVVADEYHEIETASGLGQAGPTERQIQIEDSYGRLVPVYYEKPSLAAEAGLIKKLQSAGYKVTDTSRLTSFKRADLGPKIVLNENSPIQSLVNSLGVDLLVYASILTDVVVPQGVAQDKSYGNMNLQIVTGRANLHVKVLRGDSLELLTAETFQASGADLTSNLAREKAATTAAEQAGDFLISKIQALPVASLITCKLFLSGLKTKQVSEVLKIIRDFDGVLTVSLGGVTDSGAEAAVDFRGSLTRLVDLIENSPQIKAYGLFVKKITSKTILLATR